jgi:hypothetical protein
VDEQGKPLSTDDDDTIEFVLTSEQLQSLSEAAEPAAPPLEHPHPVAAPVPVRTVVAAVPTPVFAARRPVGWHRTPLARMAVNTLAFVAFVWWSVSQLAGHPRPHAPAAMAAATRPVPVLRHPLAGTAEQSTVRVVNPFDHTEVFLFPAGTSADESRQKVAQILLQRARERQGHWERIRPEISLRTAGLAQLRRSAGPGT